jgi:hypothetical protein
MITGGGCFCLLEWLSNQRSWKSFNQKDLISAVFVVEIQARDFNK